MRKQIDASGYVHARLATLGFDLAPGVVRETRQADVVRRVVAVPDDSAVIVRGTVMMAAELERSSPITDWPCIVQRTMR